jgi:hypothetical protein
LSVEFGRQSSVAIVDQRGLLAEPGQFALQNTNALAERIAFSDKALNGVRRIQKQTLNVLD